jgi:hypothetical protein
MIIATRTTHEVVSEGVSVGEGEGEVATAMEGIERVPGPKTMNIHRDVADVVAPAALLLATRDYVLSRIALHNDQP